MGTIWGPEKAGFGFYLRFKTDTDFDFFYSGEGGGQNVQGSYLQNGDEVTLTIVTINDWGDLPDYIKDKTVKCFIQESDSLFALYKLVGNKGFDLWSMNHKPQNGQRRIIDGNIIYSQNSQGRVKENARVRKGPCLQYEFISFQLDYEPTNYFSLPKGFQIKILGVSENRTIVDGVEQNWYYCTFKPSMWETEFGWIWGGLVDVVNE
jgi:hypothetical protein